MLYLITGKICLNFKASLWGVWFAMMCLWYDAHYFNMILKYLILTDHPIAFLLHSWFCWGRKMLGLIPLNPIVWYYVCYYVWHYVWLNVVINKVSLLLLSKIMVTWIFGHYHIVHEMHSMWFMWFSHRRYKSQVLCKLIILFRSRWWNWAFHLRRL